MDIKAKTYGKSMKKIWEQKIEGKQESVNNIFATGKNGRRFMVTAGKEYKAMIAEMAGYTYKGEPSEKPLFVEIEYTFPNHVRRDVTNYDKPILDSLEGIIYKDDTQIQEIHMKKKVEKGKAETLIKVYEQHTATPKE